MDENKATEDMAVTEDHVAENEMEKDTEIEEVKKEMPKWKKFFFIYPSISRSSYVLRALAGGYVAYLAITNLKSIMADAPDDVVLVAVLSLFLLFCGAHLVISGAYALIKQEYS